MTEEYDVIIVGGGPSGSSCAAFLAKTGRKVCLLDRATFPRDKTCGDGISGRSVGILTELGLMNEFLSAGTEHQNMYGVTFSSPSGVTVPLPSAKTNANKDVPPGLVCRREVFDNVLFQNAKKLSAKTMEGFMCTDLLIENGTVIGVKGNFEGKPVELRAKVIVGADGAGGMIARKLGQNNADENHQCAAIRCYYEGVEDMSDRIELHFVKEALPGYFWVFPLPGKKANVGIGILVPEMKKQKINLQKVMFEIIEKNPLFKERFKNAKRITEVKSWLLPMGSKRMKLASNGCLLIGDAASLIDPFTGEGIGNALSSGRQAAKTINEAFEKKDFSETGLSGYQTALFAEIGPELDANYRMQRLAGHPWLLNLMINKASRSKFVKGAISDALMNPNNHNKMTDPLFILRILFA